MAFPRYGLIPILLLTAACQPAKSGESTAAATAGPATPPAAKASSAPTPLDGLWEEASAKCSNGRAPTEDVEELDFGDAGFFSVTYSPFETYKDYWGHARFDLQKGEIAFTQEGGNFIPPGLDLEGKVKLEGGLLTISEVWFGDRTPGAPPGTGCTYIFKRYGT